VDQRLVAPRTALEKIIASIWKQLLGVNTVGVYDNFFESGGHSLIAVQITNRLQQIFQVTFPARTLFEASTIDELARVIQAVEPVPGRVEQIATILDQVQQMSEIQARELLQDLSTDAHIRSNRTSA
jgi:acyl carrier protein